ncbi:MAG: M23 family metallopeptidase, partial [Desulfovibrio sp.]|nr:M23 family metallopeptidase [Desulfovibrio sp.]
PRGMHRGLDLRGAEGSPIRACADGVVALVDNLYFSGNAVYINHGDGVFSSYLHMSKPLVKPGERVERGQVIGLVGATGRVTGPHLHLGLVVQGESVDPQPLLAPREEGHAQGGASK